MTVVVYASNDASAPTLSGTAGSLANVLYTCLVLGYGSKAAAGWAREFTGTNKAVFRAASGNRLRLRVDDTGSQEARIVGYETMTDVDTGTNPFPTVAQQSGGLYVRKSDTADATVRAWYLVATGVMFYLFIDTGSSTTDPGTVWTAARASGMAFGEFTSFKSGDTYNTIIIAQTATGANGFRLGAINVSSSYAAITGHFVARNAAATVGAITVSKCSAMFCQHGDQNTIGYGNSVSTVYAYPDNVSGGLLISPVAIEEANGTSPALRGILPGFWNPLHNVPANHFDTFSGSGGTAGKSFRLVACAQSTTLGRAAVEISDTW